MFDTTEEFMRNYSLYFELMMITRLYRNEYMLKLKQIFSEL